MAATVAIATAAQTRSILKVINFPPDGAARSPREQRRERTVRADPIQQERAPDR
jgi:hypothetical protein